MTQPAFLQREWATGSLLESRYGAPRALARR